MEIWKIRHSRAMVHLKTPYFEVVSICSRFFDEYRGLYSAVLPPHNPQLHKLCAKGTSSVVALLVHYISQPRAFTGKAAYCLWCGYRIVYCAIPDRDPSFVHYVAHFRYTVTSSGAGYVTYTITAHHYAALSLLPVSEYPSQVVHPDLLHMLREIQAHSVCTT